MLTFCALPVAALGSILLAILGIAFLIFVHEFGHYIACRMTGTRVETFSIGFGPRLCGWERLPGGKRRFTWGARRLDPAEHAMDFRVAVVPLGGYVKMAGENPGEEKTGAPDEFPGKPMWARVFIICAGVIMNVITAAFFYFLTFAGGVEMPPAIAGDVKVGGPAWDAGVRPGDRFLSVGGAPTRSFKDLRIEAIFLDAGEEASVVVERDGERLDLTIRPRHDEQLGAVQLGVGTPQILKIHQGDATLVIGPQDAATVAGVPVTGGAAAAALIDDAISAGLREVEVRLVDGDALTVRPVPAPAAEQGAPVYKLGIERFSELEVTAVRGEAAAAGLRKGDVLIAALGGGTRRPLGSHTDLRRLVFGSPVEALEVQRGVETRNVPVPGAARATLLAFLNDIGLAAPSGKSVQPLVAGALTPGPDGRLYRYPSVPSRDAGLGAGVAITRIGAKEVESWEDVIRAVGAISKPDAITVTAQDADGEEHEHRITPVALQPLSQPTLSGAIPREPIEAGGVFNAAGMAVTTTGREVANVFRLIGALITGNVNFQKNIAGPITIVDVSSDALNTSWLTFLTFLAYISVTLAVLNILPIPVLDGGHLVFLLMEAIKGSPLKEETMGKIQLVGFALLLVLMFFAFSNDIRHIVNS